MWIMALVSDESSSNSGARQAGQEDKVDAELRGEKGKAGSVGR